MRTKCLLALFLLLSTNIDAQSYFQQKVNTRIEVTLDDIRHELHGMESMVYTNNSPDVLSELMIHLYPNAYKNDRTRFNEEMVKHGKTGFYYASPADRGYIDSLQFVVDGVPAEHFLVPNNPDIATLKLPKVLKPGETISITTPFHVKIPKVFSRLGHTDQSYFISQWFPKPAVYDKWGWHEMPYMDQGEFFSEYGSYDVTITLPANYVILATGNLQTAEEEVWLDELAHMDHNKSSANDSAIVSSSTWKTVRFTEDNIHDFAWFADKRYWVAKDTVILPETGNQIVCYAAFLPSHHKAWSKATEYLSGTVYNYSKLIGNYPYKTIKAVEGDMSAGGGMEYPTITIIDKGASFTLKNVIVHEAGHNWFYGLLGSNERMHAWMDEGINSYYEHRVVDILNREKNEKDTMDIRGRKIVSNSGAGLESLLYYELARTGNDQPLNIPSYEYATVNYGGDVYVKGSLAMKHLENYLGTENFDRAMHRYFNEWHYKHPYPADFRSIMEASSGKDLSWFFDELIAAERNIDFKIKSVKRSEDEIEVWVKNKSDYKLPVSVELRKGDSVLSKTSTEAFTGIRSIRIKRLESSDRVVISDDVIDSKDQNNEYHFNGLFHRYFPALRPVAGLNKGVKRKVYLAPALGYNYYDGFQLGLLLHNLSLPSTNLRFALAPLCGFNTNSFNGAGSAGYFIHPKNIFKEISFQIDAKSFHYEKYQGAATNIDELRFIKLAPSIEFIFKNNTPVHPVENRLRLKGYYVSEENYVLDASKQIMIRDKSNVYGSLDFQHKNERVFNPFLYHANLQINESFTKLAVEAKVFINYQIKKKGLTVRGFGGLFFNNDPSSPADSRYWLNTTYTGTNDYLYDGTYFARNARDGIGANQISMQEGGFKIPTNYLASPIGRSDKFLATVNIEADLPLKNIPIRLFLDAGSFTNAGTINPSGNKLLYEGGIALRPILDVFEIYIPLVMSKDFKDYQRSFLGRNIFLNSIAFRLDLYKINFLKTGNKLVNLAGG